MWIMTTSGFFSIVQKPGTRDLTVRTRVCADLDVLRERTSALGPTLARAGTDYPFRALVSHQALSLVMAQLVREIDYPSFKNAVARTRGMKRARIYGDVRRVLLQLEDRSDALYDP